MVYRDFKINTAIIYDEYIPIEASITVNGKNFYLVLGKKVTAENLKKELRKEYEEIKDKIDLYLDKI